MARCGEVNPRRWLIWSIHACQTGLLTSSSTWLSQFGVLTNGQPVPPTA